MIMADDEDDDIRYRHSLIPTYDINHITPSVCRNCGCFKSISIPTDSYCNVVNSLIRGELYDPKLFYCKQYFNKSSECSRCKMDTLGLNNEITNCESGCKGECLMVMYEEWRPRTKSAKKQ